MVYTWHDATSPPVLPGGTFPGGKIDFGQKKILRLAIQIIVVGIVFFFLGRKIVADWPRITGYPWDLSYPWLALSVVLLGLMFMGHAGGWLLILWRFRHPVPFLPGLYVWFKSLLARYVPGNVLMVVGRVIMIEPYGVPKRVSLTSVAYEQALAAASAATATVIMLPFSPQLQNFSQMIWVVMVVPPLAIAGLHPAILGRIGNWVFQKMKRDTIEEFLPFKDIIWIFFWYCAVWIIAGLALFSMVRTVTSAGISDLPIIIVSAPLAWLASVLFFISPSGLGVREGVYAITLVNVFGSIGGVASAFAILIRFWQTMLEIGFVLVVMTLVKLRHIRIGEPSEAAGSESDGAAPPL
ncbi:MAG: flippase-like domain-containing protein [Thermoleophilia bacterium]|nr:flippase-like domain-containing protein [Thermoleophilia bacterium]